MPWNGSGVFQRTDGTRTGATVWAQAKAAGVKIVTSGHDTHDEDIAGGLEACLNRNGENSPTTNIDWGGFKITNVADGDTDGDAVSYGQDGVLFTSTDAGTAAGPVVVTYRNSATPADDDLLGELRFDGEDSAGNRQEYANIQIQAGSVTSGSESGRMLVNLWQAGTERELMRLNGADSELRLKGYGTGATIGPVLIIHRDTSSPADDDVLGGINFDGEDDGGAQTTYAGIEAVSEDVTDGTEDGYLRFRAIRAGSPVTSLSPGILYDAVATTSGTSIDFTGIPAHAREIVISLAGVSTNGTDQYLIQIGDSGGVETTGYARCDASIDDTVTDTDNTGTGGFGVTLTVAVGDAVQGRMVLTLLDPSANTWVATGQFGSSGSSNASWFTSGSKSLSGTLDRVRLTTSGGSNTFDLGKMGVLVK